MACTRMVLDVKIISAQEFKPPGELAFGIFELQEHHGQCGRGTAFHASSDARSLLLQQLLKVPYESQ